MEKYWVEFSYYDAGSDYDKTFSEGQYIRKGEYHLFKLAVNVLKELEIKVIER